ncbi:NinX [Vibrio phage 1.017.O._10N.286.55.C11]|nr:NinX [Vibrio phage 1.017.O._10N.286.55.C11]AUR85486.1 NinX [Vibrio phage 1.075.O._10N.286.55.B10]AUR87032.1 NinX [Vibrio phage 1.093.O._10N.286.55.E10]AUR87105.1 NinX [Vibrio phage 1.094.O._10N.286.55.E12]
MNYEDMSDFEINTKVALIKYQGLIQLESEGDGVFVSRVDDKYDFVNIVHSNFNPCNNPSDAWLIIVENAISIQPVHYVAAGGYYKLSEIKYWTAWATNRQSVDSFTEDKNPLRAAMICFLKMKDAENER